MPRFDFHRASLLPGQFPMSTHDHQSAHHHHAGHDHTAHTHHEHGGHHVMVHAPAADVAKAYAEAYTSAQPDPGCALVNVELEAREADWQVTPGRPARAWTFNGQVPGPVDRKSTRLNSSHVEISY